MCQRSKYETLTPLGILQPLPFRNHAWQHVTMYFIEGLPNSWGKEVIFFVVDILSKTAHFMALCHPYTIKEVA